MPHASNDTAYASMKTSTIRWIDASAKRTVTYVMVSRLRRRPLLRHPFRKGNARPIRLNCKRTDFFSGSFSVPMMTPSLTDRSRKQGELILDVYDINQQRLVENGGSVFDGDRLFVEIKYRPGLMPDPWLAKSSKFFSFTFLCKVQRDSDRQQIIVENCSLASSVSDSDVRLEKVPLLTNRCPSLDSRLAVRFQRIDPVHLKSTVFQVQKFDTTSVVYLRCAIAVCTGRTEHCQEVSSHALRYSRCNRSVFFLPAFVSRNAPTASFASLVGERAQCFHFVHGGLGSIRLYRRR